MPAFDFPSPAALDDVFEPNGPGTAPSYTFDGVGWAYTPPAGAALSITVLLPAYMLAGGPDRTLRVMGLGFVPTSAIHLDGAALPTIFASAEEVQCEILASTELAPRVAQVTVRNGATESNALPLNFALTPTLDAINPAEVSIAAGATPVQCTGTNFVDGSIVYVNYVETPTTFVSATELTASCDPGNFGGSPGDSLFIQVYTGRRIASNQLLLGIVA
jgi:hypothetical protein